MDRLTTTQRIKIVKTYYKNGDALHCNFWNKVFVGDEAHFTLFENDDGTTVSVNSER